jgi:integrase
MQATKDVDDISRKCVALDPLGQRFRNLLKALKLNRRKGMGFYTLRHNFETIGGECRDQVAVDACMGHVDETMSGRYRERISDERLRAVVDTVRVWLWPETSRNLPITEREPDA